MRAAEKQFWSALEATGRADDGENQVNFLVRRFGSWPLATVNQFMAWFDDRLVDLDTWELWGVAEIVQKGCSDNGFANFRAWVLGQGTEAYELARSDPEAFGLTVDPTVPAESRDQESLLVAPRLAYQLTTGAWGPARPASGTSGRHWEPSDLPQRLPRLWRRWTQNVSADT